MERSDKVRRIMMIAGVLLLGGCTCVFGCKDGTSVQRAYVDARDECQAMAEDKVHLFSNSNAAPGQQGGLKERNSMLLAIFAKCMHAKDWGVTAPQRTVAEQPPLPVFTQPSAAPPVAASAATMRSAKVAQPPVGAQSTERGTPVYQEPAPEQRQTLENPQSATMSGVGIGPGYGSPDYTSSAVVEPAAAAKPFYAAPMARVAPRDTGL